MTNWPQVSVELPPGYGGCFGCGADNPVGLKLKFERHEGGVKAVCTPDARFQGWPGFMHGGILGCMLDEAMSWATVHAGVRCITAHFEVRLKRLTPIDSPLTITVRITLRTRKVVNCSSQICLADGTVVAEGGATHFVVGTEGGNTGGR